MLNQIEAAMLKGRGYGDPFFEQRGRDVIARASKAVGNQIVSAAALGRNEADAARKLVALVARP